MTLTPRGRRLVEALLILAGSTVITALLFWIYFDTPTP